MYFTQEWSAIPAMQIPDVSGVETLIREGAVIKAAPVSFVLCVLIAVLISWGVIWWLHRERIEKQNEEIERQGREIERLLRDIERQKDLSDPRVSGDITGRLTNPSQLQHNENEQAEQPMTRPKPTPKEKPRLVFLRPECIRVHSGIEGPALYRTLPNQNGDFDALVVSIRNEEGPTAIGIRVSARFKNAAGEEIGAGVSALLWEGDGDSKSLKPDESATVILVVIAGNQWFSPFLERTYLRHNRVAIGRQFDFTQIPSSVEVRLRNENNELLLENPENFVIAVGHGKAQISRLIQP